MIAKLLSITSILIGSCCASIDAQPSEFYTNEVEQAQQFYQIKDYQSAARCYTSAFHSNFNKGYGSDRYQSAKCWAMLKEVDSAFYQLDRCLVGNYTIYPDIKFNQAFTQLRADTRWPGLLARARIKKEQADSILRSKYPNIDLALVALLDTVDRDDQETRQQLMKQQKRFGMSSSQVQASWLQMAQKDSINLRKVAPIIDGHGWPGKDFIGEKGCDAIFLVIQHADLPSQVKYLPALRVAVTKGDAPATHLALLEDRVALRSGKKQVYGSQIIYNAQFKKYFVRPLEDPEHVDERRAKVGLVPMKDYVSQWGIVWSIEQYEKDVTHSN